MYSTEPIQKPCHLPAYKSFVDWDGTVRLCCNDWQRNHHLGNVMAMQFDKIWNAPKVVERRRNILQGKRFMYETCKHCDINGEQIGEDSKNLWLSQ